jgi:uncharacterized protein YecA (UPF0149 family)
MERHQLAAIPMPMNEEDPELRLAEVYSSVIDLTAKRSTKGWAEVERNANAVLELAQSENIDEVANKAWFLYEISKVNRELVVAFSEIKAENFYSAWCKFETIEINLLNFLKNKFYPLEEFRIPELRQLVSNWQEIFPYAIFLSPEMVIKKEICSICSLEINPWSECSHVTGKVYAGKLCYRIVKDLEFLSISFVHTPVQKYSVAFTSDQEGNVVDHYDYSVVKFVADRVEDVFDEWSFYWTKALHPHSLFSDRDKNGPCPCDSGREYSKCCFPKSGVIRPHIQFKFAKPFSKTLPNGSLGGYKKKNGPIRIIQIPDP